MQFIQLGNLFINPNEIIYVDFSDEHSCLLVLRSLDKGPLSGIPQRFIQSEEMQFGDETPEYHALKAWCMAHCEVLVPMQQQLVAASTATE